MEYTVTLALVDFLPVAFTAAGLFYVARMVNHLNPAQGSIAALGAFLTVAGGFFKALWKLVMATSGGATDINWMEDGLFVWMAPGYTLLAWSVWQAIRTARGQRVLHTWVAPVAFIVVMFAGSTYLFISRPESPAWERVLLSVMVLATVITGVFLVVFAFRQKLPLAGWLFLLNLLGIFLLNGLARLPEQPISLQWIEEGINTVAWLAFAWGAYRVYQHTRVTFGVDAARVRQTVVA